MSRPSKKLKERLKKILTNEDKEQLARTFKIFGKNYEHEIKSWVDYFEDKEENNEPK